MKLFGAESTLTDRSITLIGETVTVTGNMHELSKNGVAVVADKRGKIGTHLEVVFEIPALGYVREIKAFGHIKRVHNVDNGFFLAIEFKNLPQTKTKLIDDFLDYKKRLKKLGQRYHHAENS